MSRYTDALFLRYAQLRGAGKKIGSSECGSVGKFHLVGPKPSDTGQTRDDRPAGVCLHETRFLIDRCGKCSFRGCDPCWRLCCELRFGHLGQNQNLSSTLDGIVMHFMPDQAWARCKQVRSGLLKFLHPSPVHGAVT